MAPEDIDKTAFSIFGTHYEYTKYDKFGSLSTSS